MATPKILVVEDERIIGRSIELTLNRQGYEVTAVVASGDKALEKAAETRPDLVLMDIVLKGAIDGIAAADQIRTRFDIPVIYLTAYDGSLLERAKRTEPYGYIIKPFKEQELRYAIEIALYKHELERKLHESEEKYRNLVERANDGITIVQDGIVKYANPRLLEIWGSSAEETIGTPFASYVHPDEHSKVVDRYKRRMAGEAVPQTYETILRRKDGTELQVEVNAGVIIYQGKAADLVIVHDISARKRAAEEFQKLSQFRESIIDTANVWLDVLDANSNVMIWNKAAEEISGYSRDEVVGHGKIREWLYPDEAYRKEITTKAAAIIEKGEVVENFETTIRCKDGQYRIISWHSRNLTDERGAPSGSIALGRDFTERKRAEDALRTSEAQLSNAMKIAQLGYWEYDVANDLFTFNDHFYAIFRTSAEQVGGYTMSSARYAQLFVHPDDMPVVSIEIRKAIETSDPHYSRQLEHRIIYADGEIGYIAVRFFIIKDNQGRTVKTYGANQDITERKRIEEKLKERMGDLERLNQLFMGREHRMVELKREVNALCEQQGQRKRYEVPNQVDVLRKE